jgi:hypothetical protein
VAFIVGGELSGNSISSVEVYSPEGGCQYSLTDLPLPLLGLSLGLIDNIVVACSGYNTATNLDYQKCWKYWLAKNKWTSTPHTLNTTKAKYPVQNYKYFQYFVNDEQGEQIQLPNAGQSWSTKPPTPLGEGACSVMWRDSMIIFGGVNSRTLVQMFDFLTSNWTNLAPMTLPHYSFGCVLLPDRNRVLTVSTVPGGDERRSDIFDVQLNTWSVTGSTVTARGEGSLVRLANRVFAIGGNSAPTNLSLSATVEEYDINSGTWSMVATNLMGPRKNFAVLALPATSFSHLANGCKGV